jgi:uncharacterized integral membrane protein
MADVTLYRDDLKAGQLPEACVYSGRPATAWQRRLFLGSTPFTIYAGRGLPEARLPVSDAYRGRPLRRNITRVVLLLIFIAVVAVLAQIGTPAKPGSLAGWMEYKTPLSVIALGLFVTTVLVHCWFYYADVRCIYLDEEVMTLRNVSPEFVAACETEG